MLDEGWGKSIRDFFDAEIAAERKKGRALRYVPAILVRDGEELERFINRLWFWLKDYEFKSAAPGGEKKREKFKREHPEGRKAYARRKKGLEWKPGRRSGLKR